MISDEMKNNCLRLLGEIENSYDSSIYLHGAFMMHCFETIDSNIDLVTRFALSKLRYNYSYKHKEDYQYLLNTIREGILN